MGRIENEIEHGRKICSCAEAIWGWSTPAGKLRLERRAHDVAQLGQFTSADLLLEIGCGTGLFTEKIFQRTRAKIVATDLSPDLLAIAQQKLPEITFQIENAMGLSFPNGQFDGVYGNSILHHLEMEQALREIFRVLKEGGALVLAEPNLLNPQIAIQKNVPWIKRLLGDSPDETAIVRWGLAARMRGIGFKQVRISPFDFLHPITPQPFIKMVQNIGGFFEKIPLLKEIAGSVIIYGKKQAR